MYKKCVNCYKDGKVPNEESCKKCEDDLKAKEQECEKLRLDLIEAKAQGDYLNNLALSKTLDSVSGELDQLKEENKELKKANDCILTTLNAVAEGDKKSRQTLTEIKEIVMGIMDDDLEESSAYYGAKQILQKINECEVK